MKILLKHNKLYPVSFMAHLDVLRAVTRIIRRAALPVAFSQGYSPHMKLFFNQPLPLAVESRAEYLSVELEEDTGYPTGISVPELQIEIVITDYTPAGRV